MQSNSANILKLLTEAYPDAKCELDFKTPFELLVAVVLSAQCTDKRVNQVSKGLFEVASTAEAFNEMPLETLEEYIYSCGFYHNKAKAIKSLAKDIVEKHKGKVPDTIEGLTALSGVGNKTASVVCSVAFKGNALPVDTHVFRVAHRLNLSQGKTADKVMQDLMAEFPPDSWYTLHHTMIFHGRYTCHSQNPECGKCNLRGYCNSVRE